MTNVRVMFVGHGPSGLPEDHVVNTFHFTQSDASYAVMKPLILDALTTFYTGFRVDHPQFAPIGKWLSPWIQRECELRFYDITGPAPHVPIVELITLPAPLADAGLPEECAVVLTLEGLGLPVTPRRRGRLFLGPLCIQAAAAGSTTQPARPDVSFTGDLCIAATSLLETLYSSATWAIRSTLPTENFVPIGGGYVDNAMDTQRRRGPDTTARQRWTFDDIGV